MSVWFITGTSRGFGSDIASYVLTKGEQVVATARDPRGIHEALYHGHDDSLLALPLDVTDREQAELAVKKAIDLFGSIDVLVNNAGYGLFGAIEEISDIEARDLFDTNLFGLLNVTRAALPTLRTQRAGRIINMSSSSAVVTGAGRGIYGASKSAVEAITEALRAELLPLGIHATVVQPGSFRTEFLTTRSHRQPNCTISDYAPTAGKLRASLAANDGHQPGDPQKAAGAIWQLANTPDPPLRLQLGSDALNLVQDKLASVAAELERWRELTLSTDF
jgi:NAD(P)-dependent dehydrogenase (short-subunit alcohol dehydrogenase family)